MMDYNSECPTWYTSKSFTADGVLGAKLVVACQVGNKGKVNLMYERRA